MIFSLIHFLILFNFNFLQARAGGGCFLPETFILKSDGTSVKISQIKKGDYVLSFDENEKIVSAKVREVIETQVEQYFEITKGNIVIRATAEHPFYIGNGIYKTAEYLKKGDLIYFYVGDAISNSAISSIKKVKARVKVYNLKTDYPNTFFANFSAVHNKGGGSGSYGYYHRYSGHSHNSTSSGGSSALLFILIGIMILLFVFRSKEDSELDHIFPRSQIEKKSLKTEKLLNFISKQDQNFNMNHLKKMISETFIKLQECWQAREYSNMKNLLMPHLYNQHERQIEIMRENHEINVIENLKILSIDFVGVRYTINENGRFITALITAQSTDYYKDDRNSSFLRGSKQTETFQEFWIFKLEKGKWLLDKIEQTSESDALSKEDFFEQFTDDKLSEIYGDNMSKTGPVGPSMPMSVADKNVKIPRMINFLGENDKMWNMSKMETDASLCFIMVYEAWAKSDETKLSPEYISPDMHKKLKELIVSKRNEGISFEFRNLCIRKVDVVLVNNRTIDKEDEFVARFSAHAQKKVIKNGVVIMSDEYVKPFVEYWNFGKCDKVWKLKEILPKGVGEKVLTVENTDEEVTPAQLEWYYSKKRAY